MQRWTIHLEGGPRRVNHAAVAIGECIYTFGGYCTGEDYETTRPMDVHVLNTVSLRWSLLPCPSQDDVHHASVPYQRYGHTAVSQDKVAYIWGGRNDNDGACNVLFAFDSRTHRWSCPKVMGDVPGARDGHSSCLINGRMYIFGGYEEQIDRFSNDLHALNLATKTWRVLDPKGMPPRWRDFHTATGSGTIMYIFGGRSDQGGALFTNHEIYCNKIQAYDTAINTWLEISSTGVAPIGRRSHSAFIYKCHLYIFGGYSGLHDIHFRDIFRFDPSQNRWSMVKVRGQGPCARRRQCCCLIGSSVFLFGGTSPINPDNRTAGSGDELDLIDHSDLHVLDFSPSLKTLCQLAVLENKLDQTCLPTDIRRELGAMTTNNLITRSTNTSG